MSDKLSQYRSKRDFSATPEPSGTRAAATDGAGRFVVHEHHATNLHWDLRLERDGVLVSWALPKGIPTDPKRNRLAVHTEDHPLEYIDFHGEIPEGSYGAGKMTIWDEGAYEAEKFHRDEVIVTFHGERLTGRYALFQTKGKNWMIHRMDAPVDPSAEPMPEALKPMLAKLAQLPSNDSQYGFEVKWDGVRVVCFSEAGHVRLANRNLRDCTAQYPEIKPLGRALGATDAILDGEVVAFDRSGKPDFGLLQHRMHLASDSAVRRRMKDTPVTYVIFDLLYLEGHSTMSLSYTERRALLEQLELDGPHWQTPAYHRDDGEVMLAASAEQGLEGVVAKRLDSRYAPGVRSTAWLKIKNHAGQEFVIGGWTPGKGRRSATIGSLALGYNDGDGKLRYAGNVGTGFTEEALRDLAARLEPLRGDHSPFTGQQPPKGTVFVAPELVAEVQFGEWTRQKIIRHPVFKGLRTDKPAQDVVLEEEKTQDNADA